MSDTKHILAVGFGGPTKGCCKHFDECPGEAYCFVSGIFGHNPNRKERIDEVVEHYKELGGFSKFNQITEAQAAAVQAELASRGMNAEVHCGYHHWQPYIKDKVAELAEAGVEEFLILVMSLQQSSVSWDAYIRLVGEALKDLGDKAPKVLGVVEPYWNSEGFTTALAERVDEAAAKAGLEVIDPNVGVLLSAHSIPESVADTSPYCDQVRESAQAVAKKLHTPRYTVAYQSQPEDSRIPWTGPFLEDALRMLASRGVEHVIGAPVGFLCDNVEVEYDLGIEGAKAAEECGVSFHRAESVNTHPALIATLADLVQAKFEQVTA